MANLDDVREYACHFIGRELTDEEWNTNLPKAQRKLEWIISREGDADGERNEPYYLGKLVEEAVTAAEFSRYCEMRYAANIERRTNRHETVAAYT